MTLGFKAGGLLYFILFIYKEKRFNTMINMETVKFIMMIDSLCQLSVNGVRPLSDISDVDDVDDCVYFDDKNSIYNALTGETYCRAVSILIDEEGYDPENNMFWDEYIDTDSKYSVTVVIPDTDEPFILVKCGYDVFYIQDGECRAN